MNKRKLTLNNGVLIMISVALAFLLWIYVNGSQIDMLSQDINNIPVVLTGQDALAEKGLTINSDVKYYVNLRLKGQQTKLASVDASSIKAEVDMKGARTAGTYQPEGTITGVPNNVIIDEIKPEALSIEVYEISKKDQTVNVITSGKPAEGLKVIASKATETVRLEGDNKNLAKVTDVTATVDVQDMAQDSVRFASVTATDKNGDVVSGVTCNPAVVETEITLGVTKKVELNAPKIKGELGSGYKITDIKCEPSSVQIGGKADVLAGINHLDVESVSVEGAVANVTESSRVILPSGVMITDGNNEVKVTVSVSQIIEKSFNIDTIENKNLSGDLQVQKISESTVNVKIEGLAEEMNNLSPSDIEVYLDLSGKKEGVHTVPITVKTNKGKVTSVSPSKLKIELTKK